MSDYRDYVDPAVSDDDDDGIMPQNIADFADAIVGHRIVSVLKDPPRMGGGRTWREEPALRLTLDNGREVDLIPTDDCCAHTDLEQVIEHLPCVDHIITAVTSSEGYESWHILADAGEVLELLVSWSAGNPFYYSYGFDIQVRG